MKRFLCLLLSSALLLSLAVYGVDRLYQAKRPAGAENTDKYADMPRDIQLCNLGSSHGEMALYYEPNTDLTAFNFALTAQRFSYDLRILDTYRDRIAPGAVVLLDLSYFSLFGLPETETAGFREKNQRYYKIMPPWKVKDFSFGDMVTTLLPSLTAYQDLPAALLGPAKDPPAVYNTWELRVASEVPGLEEEAAWTACGHLITEKLDENGRRIVNREEVDALYAIIYRCRALGATPVLLVTPLLAEYLREVDLQAPTFYDEFDALVDQVRVDTGVPYFDYSHDPRFTHSPRLFANSDHLNKAGATAFTRVVMDEVVTPILEGNK